MVCCCLPAERRCVEWEACAGLQGRLVARGRGHGRTVAVAWLPPSSKRRAGGTERLRLLGVRRAASGEPARRRNREVGTGSERLALMPRCVFVFSFYSFSFMPRLDYPFSSQIPCKKSVNLGVLQNLLLTNLSSP